MLNLNDDCLFELMSYLPLGDLYSFSRTCQRLNKIAERLYGRFAHLEAKDFLTSRDKLKTVGKMCLLIKEVARHVISFDISRKIYSRNGLLKCRALIILVLHHCHNLVDLKIGFYIHDDRSLREICALPNFRKLEAIDVRGNVKLQNLNQLKNLTLTSDSTELNVSHLLYLKNLQSLCLNIPLELNADLFSKICDNNPGIKKIKLNIMTDTIIKVIVEKLVHLEDFTLPRKSEQIRYTISGILRIAKIKSLTSFTVSHSIPGLLTRLAHMDQLESLTFTGSSSGDIYQMKYFTKLKYLKTTNLNGAQLNALKSQSVLEHLDISSSNYIIDNGEIVLFVRGATKLKYLAICKCNGLDAGLLSLLSDLVKSGICKQKLTVVCDMVRKRDTKNYPWLNVVVEKTVKFFKS